MEKLFVGGLPPEMGEFELAKMIAPYGDIATLEIVRDIQGGGKGYAYVEMHLSEAASEVIGGLNGISLRDRQLVIRRTAEPQHYRKSHFNHRDSAAEKNSLPFGGGKRKRPRTGGNQAE